MHDFTFNVTEISQAVSTTILMTDTACMEVEFGGGEIKYEHYLSLQSWSCLF